MINYLNSLRKWQAFKLVQILAFDLFSLEVVFCHVFNKKQLSLSVVIPKESKSISNVKNDRQTRQKIFTISNKVSSFVKSSWNLVHIKLLLLIRKRTTVFIVLEKSRKSKLGEHDYKQIHSKLIFGCLFKIPQKF
jgi:hypothetical protein